MYSYLHMYHYTAKHVKLDGNHYCIRYDFNFPKSNNRLIVKAITNSSAEINDQSRIRSLTMSQHNEFFLFSWLKSPMRERNSFIFGGRMKFHKLATGSVSECVNGHSFPTCYRMSTCRSVSNAMIIKLVFN